MSEASFSETYRPSFILPRPNDKIVTFLEGHATVFPHYELDKFAIQILIERLVAENMELPIERAPVNRNEEQAFSFSKAVHGWLISVIIFAFLAIIAFAVSVLTGAVIAKAVFASMFVLSLLCAVFWLQRAERENQQFS
jgi:hypothetical protein